MKQAGSPTRFSWRSVVSIVASVGMHVGVLLLVATHPWAPPPLAEPVAVELATLEEPAQETPPKPEAAPPPETPPIPSPALIERPRPSPASSIRKASVPRPQPTEQPRTESAVAAEAPPEAKVQAVAAPMPKPPASVGAPHKDNYVAEVQARLVAVKRYPALARSHNAEGVVVMAFSLDRKGTLIDWRIDRKSGDPSLDDEAEAMVQRAAPYPPFPDTLPSEKLDLVVPITFTLRRG